LGEKLAGRIKVTVGSDPFDLDRLIQQVYFNLLVSAR
jgi:hypothetical protein